ncbi:right-handed parallel beta-helix repeat-containing protein, partial [Sedimenticola sp.]|uniref:right-handed parallel beta-helix repeat-containing protein n=1 Tax=Sedimenticola sp. TaxID=1940285 RepID=UPI003D0D0627
MGISCLLLGIPAVAADIIVDDPIDGYGTPGTLRVALEMANNGDTIRFAPQLAGATITINPSYGELMVRRLITIDGDINGDTQPDIVLDGGGIARIMTVRPYSTGQVVINGLVFRRGYSPSSGGCLVQQASSVSITHSAFDQCVAVYDGGAILNFNELHVQHTEFRDNLASRGAGIVSFSGSPIEITESRFVGNVSNRWGGGTYFYGGSSVQVSDSYFADNFAL